MPCDDVEDANDTPVLLLDDWRGLGRAKVRFLTRSSPYTSFRSDEKDFGGVFKPLGRHSTSASVVSDLFCSMAAFASSLHMFMSVFAMGLTQSPTREMIFVFPVL